jgi:O-antigen ligase
MLRALDFWKHIPALPLPPPLEGRSLRWLRVFAPLAVLLLAAALGPVMTLLETPGRDRIALALTALAVIPFALTVLRFFIRFPALGPILVLFASIFIPFGIQARGSLVTTSLILSTVFLGLWLMRMLVVERRFHLTPTPANWPILGFMATVLASLVWSNLYRDVLVNASVSFLFVQLSQGLVMLCLPGLYLLVVNHFPSLDWLKALVFLLLAGAALGLISEFVAPLLHVQTRGTFTMWIVSICLALSLFHRRLSVKVRLVLGGLLLGWCYWSFGLRITWLASWLPTLIVISLLLFLRSWKLFVLAAAGVALWMALNQNYINTVIDVETDESGHTRLDAWMMNWTVTREHLLFGTGPAGYTPYYMSYFPTRAMATHNNYLDIVSQLGFVGLGFYLTIFGVIFWQGWRLSWRLRGRGDFAEALTLAALAGTAGCIVINAFGDWLIPFAYTQGIAGFDYAAYNWLFMAAIPLIDRLVQTARPQPRHNA